MRVWWSVVVVVVVVVAAVVVVDASRPERQASRCDPREPCTALRSCRSFKELLQRPTANVLNRLRQAICDRNRRNPKVCCPGAISITLPTTPPTSVTPTPSTGSGEDLLPARCRSRGKRQITPFVIAGEDAKVGELPWMALLGYNSVTRPLWSCGGTLISARYVVTAAHCVHSQFTQGLTLEVVRLGELDLTTPMDCTTINSRRVCAPFPQDFTPERVIMHPSFNTRTDVSDDIALIRLNKPATLNRLSVQPLCLPPGGANVESILNGRKGEVAGWGLTETGTTPQILQRANLDYVNKATCNPIFNNSLIAEQICFGGSSQDSCRGDSGGPVVVGRSSSNPLLVGIVSRGRDFRCGLVGVPAVYTHVAAYRSWITSQLRP